MKLIIKGSPDGLILACSECDYEELIPRPFGDAGEWMRERDENHKCKSDLSSEPLEVNEPDLSSESQEANEP